MFSIKAVPTFIIFFLQNSRHIFSISRYYGTSASKGKQHGMHLIQLFISIMAFEAHKCSSCPKKGSLITNFEKSCLEKDSLKKIFFGFTQLQKPLVQLCALLIFLFSISLMHYHSSTLISNELIFMLLL